MYKYITCSYYHIFKTCSNVIIIGCPGAGKSTVGAIAAKTLGMKYIDFDLDILEHAWGTKVGDKVNLTTTVITTIISSGPYLGAHNKVPLEENLTNSQMSVLYKRFAGLIKNYLNIQK